MRSDPRYSCGMTKKIGISLSDELYEWAQQAVSAGRAETVSSVIAQALEAERRRAALRSLVEDLKAEAGEPTAQDYAWADEAIRKAFGVGESAA
jgi:Arc/MetJ-type ribon-helix-helix transcriptional regulator